jgi:DNA-3-methyladenine glycosylase I
MAASLTGGQRAANWPNGRGGHRRGFRYAGENPKTKDPNMASKALYRCSWATTDALAHYHDTEWGVPSRDDRHLFEMLVLEGAQAGLSWSTILNKRDGYRELFADFALGKVAKFTEKDVARLMEDARIVRNRAKIQSAIVNAQAVQRIQAEHGSLAAFLWSHVADTPIDNPRAADEPPQVSTPESDALSRSLKAYGCKFVGTTICYAFMQATGMVNDHEAECACRKRPGTKVTKKKPAN